MRRLASLLTVAVVVAFVALFAVDGWVRREPAAPDRPPSNAIQSSIGAQADWPASAPSPGATALAAPPTVSAAPVAAVPEPAAVSETAATRDRAPPSAAANGRLSLARILEIARRRVPGEVIEVDEDEDDGRIEYELEILAADGQLVEMTIDAHTGRILEVDRD